MVKSEIVIKQSVSVLVAIGSSLFYKANFVLPVVELSLRLVNVVFFTRLFFS